MWLSLRFRNGPRVGSGRSSSIEEPSTPASVLVQFQISTTAGAGLGLSDNAGSGTVHPVEGVCAELIL